VMRRGLKHLPGAWGPYEPCPCASGKKVRFCCGSEAGE
jgi:uncharacterized protein YecA (UPF0149 family)